MSRIELAKYRMERAKKMLIKSKDSLQHEHYKLSTNRSYYAMFSAAKALLTFKEWYPSLLRPTSFSLQLAAKVLPSLKELDARRHAGIILLFNQYFVKNGIFPKELSKLLPKAKNIREEVDYRDFVEISKEDAEHQIKNAEKFIHQAEKTMSEMIWEG
ncbi:MAG: HEPN domain-containing protein [Candidatus Cloacimonetes bacterium]|nr:HEPN domain-containing protein [Candidatus Cloacimonadota bacterium]MBL7086025.1 HEPN domain-containing protein [Candidatus Cloacimonadota bacterium]